MFKGFIGQSNIKRMLNDLVYCYKAGHGMPHLLMIAGAGSGKTTLCRKLANAMGCCITESYGPTLDWDSIKRILSNVSGVWYIDEIHGLSKELQDKLLGVMLDFKYIDGDKEVRVNRFTMLGSTTDPDLLISPFMDRFHVLCFEDYCLEECREVALTKVNGAIIANECLDVVSNVCGFNPRKILNMIADMRVYHIAHNVAFWNMSVMKEFMLYRGLGCDGLTGMQRKYLEVIGDKCMSLQLISALMHVKSSVVSILVEPTLIARGMVEITSKGRRKL